MKPVGGHGWGQGITDQPAPQPRDARPAQCLRQAPRLPPSGHGDATGTETCTERSREAGVPSKRPGTLSPLPASHPVPGPAVTPGSEQEQSRPRRPRRAALPLPGPTTAAGGRRPCSPSATERATGRASRTERSGRGPCPGAERPHLPGGFLRAAGRLVRHLASPLAQPWRRPSERRSHRARERRARSRWPSRRWFPPPAQQGRTIRRQRSPRTFNSVKWNGHRLEQPQMLPLIEKSP